MNYTKGEWKKVIVGERAETLFIKTLDEIICEVFPIPNEGLANAHLIAAAPDMYEALRELYRILEEDEDYKRYNPKMKQAEQALAKAEGK
jgi:alpha-N-acetylglucosamine transferase